MLRRPVEVMSQRLPLDSSALRARFAADLAAGKTVALSADELADPHVRSYLPELLDEISRTQPEASRPPMRVPGFTLLGEIGHGGMSTVWLAKQEVLDRHVAVKIAPKWASGDPKRQQRLLQEARAMARVGHPNIVAIHDIVEIGDTVAIAMDWIDGLTLAAIVAALKKAPGDSDMQLVRNALGTPATVSLATTTTQFFVRMLRDIALAVQRVHDAGLLHLDVKPSNILVRRDGTPLLADFGVVREIDLQATHTKTFAGTPVYAAPEQLRRADAEFGPHTDVYSLGITLYEALTRTQPLQHLGLTRILHDIVSGRIPPLNQQIAAPADLANIVHKAIAPEPALRYPTAAAFAADLTAFLEHRPVSARPLSRLQRMRRWARNEPWKAGLAATLALLLPLLLGLGVYVWTQMPALTEAARLEQLARANQLKQEAYQSYINNTSSETHAIRKLHEAIEVDPGESSLVCLLSLMLVVADPELEHVLQRHARVVASSRGLQLFAEKVRQRRFGFTADEVATLRTSTSPTDRYVLALDRLFVAEDASYEEVYDEAYNCMVQAVLLADSDPLLHGLAAWAALRGTRSASYHVEAVTLRKRWPNDPIARRWLAVANEPMETKAPSSPTTLGEELVTEFPDHPGGYEVLAGVSLRSTPPDFDRTIQMVERARSAGVGSGALTTLRLYAAALRDGKAAAEKALAETPPENLSLTRRLRLMLVVDPAQARKMCDDILLARPRPDDLDAVMRTAERMEDEDLAERAWQRWRTAFPDRVRHHNARIGAIYPDPKMPQAEKLAAMRGIAELAAQMTLRRSHLANNGAVFLVVFTTTRNWKALLAVAERIIEFGKPEQSAQAHAYAGMAASRLGLRSKAAVHLGAATLSRVTSNWYASSLLEKAWLLCEPEGLAETRNPVSAREALTEFESLVPSMRGLSTGPWYRLVSAEVAFANGHTEEAIQNATKGLSQGHLDGHAPENTREMLEDALERYRR